VGLRSHWEDLLSLSTSWAVRGFRDAKPVAPGFLIFHLQNMLRWQVGWSAGCSTGYLAPKVRRRSVLPPAALQELPLRLEAMPALSSVGLFYLE
jgi:hypothetical protein